MLWIVGNVFKDTRNYLEQHKIPYGVIVQKDQPIPQSLRNIPNIAQLDFSSAKNLVDTAVAAKLDPSSILAAGYENYVLPAAILCDYYHVPGLTPHAAHLTTDKSLMRAAFARHDPSITPEFQKVAVWDDIESFMLNHKFPVMLKPTNLMKSLYITKNSSMQELADNFKQLQDYITHRNNKVYTLDPTEIIIEECMDGTMHTVAGFVDETGTAHLYNEIVNCINGQDAGFSDNYIYSRQLPSKLNQSDTHELLRVARAGVAALNLTSTMLHIEMILTASGPKIIEIGARIGGYRTRMYKYASNIDMNAAMIDIASGTIPNFASATLGRSMAVIELFPDTEGPFSGIANEQSLKDIPSLQYFSVKSSTGKLVGRASHGYRAAAVIILGNKDLRQFTKDLDFVRQQVTVETSLKQ